MTEVAGLFLQVAELSVSAAWMIPAVCALSLIPRATSHAPGAVLSGGAGAQSADAAGSVSGIAPHLYSDCSARAYICLRIRRSRSWASSWRTRGRT